MFHRLIVVIRNEKRPKGDHKSYFIKMNKMMVSHLSEKNKTVRTNPSNLQSSAKASRVKVDKVLISQRRIVY